MESYRRAVFGGLADVARPQWLFLQFLLREHQERQAARAGGHHSDPLGGPPSSEFVPGYDAAAWIGGSSTNGKGAACRLGQQRRRRLGRGLREEASGGSRKVGQSDPRGQHQGGMKRRFTASPGLSMLILKKTAKLDRAPVNGLALFRMAIYSLRPMQTEVTDIHGNVRNSRKPNRR